MSYIFNENFLLQSEVAKSLYHQYVRDLPIIDYHNHLPVNEIANDTNFGNITKLWLGGDHYKWRALRTLGIPEKYITGDASDKEKFLKWAEALPQMLRNPLFHWSHMELSSIFGINEYLNIDSAERIYEETNAQISSGKCTPRGILSQFKVEMLGTTDDPTDCLEHHLALKETKDFSTEVKPSFRPDKALAIDKGDTFRAYIQTLSTLAKVEITDLDSLIEALQKRVDFFAEIGCVASDHGLSFIPTKGKSPRGEVGRVLKEVLNGNDNNAKAIRDDYQFYLLSALCEMYYEKSWVQQFHLGAMRNTNSSQFLKLGPDAGYDSIGDHKQADSLAKFLNHLEANNKLAKTVIYNLNPAFNAVFATLVGNFQDGNTKGKIQFGAAWWFLDQLDGMTEQINILSNMGVVSTFVGMLTDSRSFLSFPRHDYFRRLLCNIFAEDINKGLLPNDEKWIGGILADIAYYNANEYFLGR